VRVLDVGDTHVDNLLGGRISSSIQGGNLSDTKIHLWIEDRAVKISAWAKVGRGFDPRIKPDISAEHLRKFRE